jgi:undecaprenyl phosphate-alpha-L-ara4N flippase subunit ArnE
MTALAFAPLVAMISCTVVANLLLKAGSADAPSPILLGMLSWRTIGGLAAFGCAGLLYTRVLRFLPLNVAQSYAAAQFIAVILGSRFVLGETIPAARWAGISMIVLGILVVAWHEA